MSVQMFCDRDLCVLVTFAARRGLLLGSVGDTAERLHRVNWDAYEDRYGPQVPRAPIQFDWAEAGPAKVFSLAGLYLYNVPDAPADIVDLMRAIRKAATAEVRGPPRQDDPQAGT